MAAMRKIQIDESRLRHLVEVEKLQAGAFLHDNPVEGLELQQVML